MYKKMLVLLDGSTTAEVVFSYARELSNRLNLDLELLNVCSHEQSFDKPMHEAYIERKARELEDECASLSAAAGGGQNKNCEIKGTVVTGNPAEEILSYAEKNSIDLILLSTHGSSGSNLFNLGSVANKVIHAAKVPVWVVPAGLRDEVIMDKVPRRGMVIPLDGSKAAEEVIPHAINIAKQRAAETDITLVHVIPFTRYYFSHADITRDEEEKKAIIKYLEGVVAKIQAAGIAARYELLNGEPPETIVEYVKNNPTQLIAMATQGRSGLNLMVFGSVAESVLQLVKKTPIFFVKIA